VLAHYPSGWPRRNNEPAQQERLGHADIGTTMDIYTHMMPEMQEQVAEALDRFLDGDGA
jgi:integrase